MRSLAEHRAATLTAVHPLTPVRMPLADTLGLVTAEPVTSRVDLPGFDNSAMDGYAARAADTPGQAVGPQGQASKEAVLDVIGEVAAGGDAAGLEVGPGQAVRIMTGAMMPAGADAVVKVEDTDGGLERVTVRQGVDAGKSVRRRAEDVRAGDQVLDAGLVLDARRIAVLAATGHGDALVRPRPRVAVVSTGAELVPPGDDLPPGHLHDSNSFMLDACVTEAGGVTTHRLSIGDDATEVVDTLRGVAADVDLVVTSGGVSMGAYDVVKEALTATGEAEFVQVAMQPGKPQGFGGIGPRRTPLFALPGNPVSSYVSFEVFVRPAIRRLLGRAPETRPTITATLAHDLRSPVDRTQVARAIATPTSGGWHADPVGGQGSHFVADLSRANALVIVPADVTSLAEGDEVEMWLLDGAEDRIEAW